MSLKPLDLKELQAIIDWVNVTEDVRELSLKYGELELFVSRNSQSAHTPSFREAAPVAPPAVAPQQAAPVASVSTTSAAAPVAPVAQTALAADEVLVKAPMVGTFYASPKPGAPAFVSVGDAVTTDTILCIVEVMKLMNNIEAGVEGTIAKILVENEQAVEYGQPLMIIRRKA